MTFKNWIKAQGGTKRLANKLGVERMTAYYWSLGKTRPRRGTMKHIIRLAKGKLKVSDIVNL